MNPICTYTSINLAYQIIVVWIISWRKIKGTGWMIKWHLLILLPFVTVEAYKYTDLFIFYTFRASVEISQCGMEHLPISLKCNIYSNIMKSQRVFCMLMKLHTGPLNMNHNTECNIYSTALIHHTNGVQIYAAAKQLISTVWTRLVIAFIEHSSFYM